MKKPSQNIPQYHASLPLTEISAISKQYALLYLNIFTIYLKKHNQLSPNSYDQTRSQ